MSDLALEHLLRHLILKETDESMAKAIRRSWEISLLRDSDPVIPERGLGEWTSGLRAEYPFRPERPIPDHVLIDNAAGDLMTHRMSLAQK